MNLACIIAIGVLVITIISIVQNKDSTYISKIKITLLKILSIEVNKKEKRSDEALTSHPNGSKT